MNILLTICLLVALFYVFVQFARQEHVQDEFEEAIIDVEGRLEWARTRRSYPFGMKAQLEVSSELMRQAKRLWKENKWQQAYRVVLQSQEAMSRAQSIYCGAQRMHSKAESPAEPMVQR